ADRPRVLLLDGQADVVIRLRLDEGGPGELQAGAGLFKGRLVGAVVDLEEDLPFLDQFALPEEDVGQVAPDAGLEVHRLHRLGAGGEHLEVGDRAFERAADLDDGRGRVDRLRVLVVAAGRRQGQGREGQNAQTAADRHNAHGSPFGSRDDVEGAG